MKRRTGLLCAMLLLAAWSWAGENEVVKSVINARTQGKTFPLPSAQIPDLNEKAAYALQAKVVTAMIAIGDSIRGYKAGLTSKAAQDKFGVHEPLLGPLFKSGELNDRSTIRISDFSRLFVETEIGYVAGAKIAAPVKDVAALKKMMLKVFPTIELPDLRFSKLKGLKGTDIVVDAVASAAYIVGTKLPIGKVDAAGVEVALTRDGKKVYSGKASDAMGDQWKALLWLVNGVVGNGYTIEPGQILLTGSLGKMIPAKPGNYVADFGALGTISFTVK